MNTEDKIFMLLISKNRPWIRIILRENYHENKVKKYIKIKKMQYKNEVASCKFVLFFYFFLKL